MLNFVNVFFLMCLVGPLFLFREMARWQQTGYIVGVILYLLNLFVIGSGVLGGVAIVVLFISCVQVVVEYFPFRAG